MSDVWRANPGAQKRFLMSAVDEVLYGGAAGGGKSWALLMWASFGVENPDYRCLLMRRTYPELQLSLIDESRKFYPHLRGGGGTYNEQRKAWTFPSGAQVIFGSCEHEFDVHRYQSAAFAGIGFDQVESFTRYQYTYMLSRCRNVFGLPNQMRATANPGGRNGPWVKRRWIDTLTPNRTKWFVDEREVPKGTPNAMSRKFIPASVQDNPKLMETDPAYVARLMALPDRERKQLLDGDWDVGGEGIVYDEFDTTVHVVDPFEIPPDWPRRRAIDFGYNNPFVCQWWARSPDDELFLYREIYEPERLVSELGPQIKKLSEGEKYVGTVADHDAENRAELDKQGVPTVPAIKPIAEGIQEVRKRLHPNAKTGKPRLFIMRGCTELWESVKALYPAERPRSTHEEFSLYRQRPGREGKSDDEEPIDEHNHGMDALRYLCMSLVKRGGVRSRGAAGI